MCFLCLVAAIWGLMECNCRKKAQKAQTALAWKWSESKATFFDEKRGREHLSDPKKAPDPFFRRMQSHSPAVKFELEYVDVGNDCADRRAIAQREETGHAD
jgi:hypothetical protein